MKTEPQFKRVLFLTRWWQNELLRGVARHAAEQGWHLDLQTLMTGVMPEDWTGDGIITTLGFDGSDLPDFLARVNCPAVSLSLNSPEIPVPRVGIDNEIAGRLAATHFLERGFRSFAFYDQYSSYAGELRLEPFERLVGEAGYSVEQLVPPNVPVPQTEMWQSRQAWLIGELVRLPRPLAVFAADDSSGVELIEACLAASLSVPDDVAVLGMLDIALFRESTLVPLSSITVDFDQNTRVACDLLARMMAGEPAPPAPILLPPTGIAVRRSSDTIAATHPKVAAAIRYMREHLEEPIEMAAVARAVGSSRTLFFKAFREDLERSPNDVLTGIRIEAACRRLEGTDEKLETIAEACGFGNRTNLYRRFTQRIGESPAAWRSQRRGAEPETR